MKQFRSPLIWRLILWFFLLSLIPIGIVLVFVQRQVRDAFIDQKIQGLNDQAHLFSLQVAKQPEQLQKIVEEFTLDHQTVFLLDEGGIYIAHSDLRKVGSPAVNDIGADILQNLLAEQSTQINNSIDSQYIASVKVDSTNYVAVITASSEVMAKNIAGLSNGVVLQLAVSLLITSLAGGTAILVVLGPIVQLSNFADRLGGGELDAEFDDHDLEGELAILARSLNNLAIRVRASIFTLEQRVEERTAELANRNDELNSANTRIEHRAAQFEALVQVAQAITSIRDLKELLPHVAAAISKEFGFYHVGIFLMDENNEYAVLSATNSEGGKKMLDRKHRLRVGEQGIVGNVTLLGKPRIAMDVGADAIYFNNPELPDTHSEMALPLKSGERIIGALDVQSQATGAFTEEDIQMLELLASQVSLAIENARLFDETRQALAEAEIASRQLTREAWGRIHSEMNLLGYRYDLTGAFPLEEPIELIEPSEGKNNGKQMVPDKVVVPIALRGETIGNLVVQSPSGALSQDQIDIIKAVAERVALSAENARLFEETTRRAERERLVSDITGKIRSVTDPQSMIQTAMDELRKALGASRVEVIPQSIKGSE